MMTTSAGSVSLDEQMKNVNRAVLTAFEAMKDLSGSDVGRRLTPIQFLAAASIAAIEQATRMGLPWRSASETLRDLADGIENL